MAPLTFRYSAVSDVGRVRKDNQDSGYGGPFLLAVCDGVGGAARGDVASSTTIQQLRRLDQPAAEESLTAVAGALHRAHDRIAELVEEDPGLTGTSTTATLAQLDGSRLAVGHLGDSRAYLWHEGELTQLTHDHTFVQGLVDEGRITEAEARTHPRRNLILKALDGMHETEPDLFHIDLVPGDRLLLCSDGASGALERDQIAEVLSTGTPESAALDLVRSSLDAGSSDNVTCVVADVLTGDAGGSGADGRADEHGTDPLLVGAAADLARRPRGGLSIAGRTGLGRTGRGSIVRARSGDTGEIPTIPAAEELPSGVDFAIASDPIDTETARYAPRPPRRLAWLTPLLVVVVVVGLLWIGVAAVWSWSQQQYYVGAENGRVAIYRGLSQELLGLDLSDPYSVSNIELADLPAFQAKRVSEGIEVDSLDDARQTVHDLAAGRKPEGRAP